jgi:hypothetical protein
MRRTLLAALGVAVAVLPVSSLSHAQLPAGDSVVVFGSALVPGPPSGANPVFDNIDIRTASGPSGESPSGRVSFFLIPAGNFVGSQTADNVNCLAVNGNRAIIGFRDEILDPGQQWTAEVVDNGPPNSGLDTFAAFPQLGPGGPCQAPSDPAEIVNPGDVAVRDAPPFPTSKEQCKNGGWRNFPGFKNQGDCVSFVATPGSNPPAGS